MNILIKGINKIFPKYQWLPTHIKRLYIITFLGELYLIIPIWMFFYLRFLSFEQVALITIIQHVTAILFEVPTGAFADIFGKRKTLIICYILYSISLRYIIAQRCFCPLLHNRQTSLIPSHFPIISQLR